MVLRVFDGACVLFSLPPRVYHMIQICRRRRTEAQVALRTNLGTSMHAEQVTMMVGEVIIVRAVAIAGVGFQK